MTQEKQGQITTNNRMELTACIKGLEALDGPCLVTVHSDSQYVVNGITKGWARLLELCEKHDVEFQWVRGHNGNRENERCNRPAVEMTRRKTCRSMTGTR